MLFLGEIVLELWAAARQRRRDVQPRGHRGGTLSGPARGDVRGRPRPDRVLGDLRHAPRPPGGLRDVLELRRGRAPLGLERHDTLEALRKVDKLLGRIARAGRYAPRPYEIVVLSDHGQTQGATFKQRERVRLRRPRPPLDRISARTDRFSEATRTTPTVGLALEEARDARRAENQGPGKRVDDGAVVVLGSGNLALIYLMEERRRLTLEEIEARHPRLVPALRSHPTWASCWLTPPRRARGTRAARGAVSAGRACRRR